MALGEDAGRRQRGVQAVRRLHIAVLALAAWSTLPASAAVTEERYAIMSNGDPVGTLSAKHDGRAVTIDYAVVNNGRGPKLHERLELGKQDIPSAWQINGNSLMGGTVQESMRIAGGKLQWTSQADSGSVPLAAPKLYIGNDASPWAFGLYARILMGTPNGKLDVLPAGSISLAKGRTVTLAHGGKHVKLTAVVLSGITLTPKFLLMDEQRRMFALLDESPVIRAGYESHYAELKALAGELSSEYLSGLQRQLAHRFDQPVRIRNVRVFDPVAGKAGPLSLVTFYRGRISAVVPEGGALSDAVHEIDGKGGTLVPGLHDMHAHNTPWSALFNIAAGVTTTRDMGSENDSLLKLTQRIEAGELAGPNIVPAGFIEGRSPFAMHLGILPATLDEGKAAVRWYGDRGYRWIKIYNSMNPEWVPALAAEAHRVGLGVLGHVPAFATPDQMLEAGYDEITHVNQLMLGWLLQPGEDTRTPLRLTALARAADLDLASAPVRKTVALMKEKNAGLDTTLAIVEQLMMSRSGEVLPGAAPYLEHMPIGYQRYRKRSYVKFKDDAEKQRYADAFVKVLQTAALLRREGVPLWPGTDDPSGFLLHRELQLYVKAGMTPAEVLRIASYDCARHLGRGEDSGAITQGRDADFLLLPADPVASLDGLHDIRMVVKGGVVYYPDEIYRALNIVPFGGK